jgi:DNA-binding HxlR family transcriptional regulator
MAPEPQAAPSGDPDRSTGRTDPHLADALASVGDRWTLLLVAALLEGPRRFGELADDVPGIAPNVLTQRLRHLEQQGLVVATPYSQRPVRFAYELTASGRDLADAVALLASWGARHEGTAGAAAVHPTCGSALETRLWCPTCERVVDADEPDELVRV